MLLSKKKLITLGMEKAMLIKEVKECIIEIIISNFYEINYLIFK